MFHLIRKSPTWICRDSLLLCDYFISESAVSSHDIFKAWIPALDFYSQFQGGTRCLKKPIIIMLMRVIYYEQKQNCFYYVTVPHDFWAVVLISSCLIYFASYDGNCQQKCKHFVCLPLCLGLITRQLRRMYGLRAVFLECCQPVRPLNWLSSLYGLTVKKESIIFDIMEQKSWRSV